jgi:hypothetical protein
VIATLTDLPIEARPEHDMSRIKAFFRRLIVATHEQGLARGSSATSVVANAGGIEETLACVREQSALITYAGRMLATNLRTRAVAEGLQSVEDICATLLVTDELISFITRAGASGLALEKVHRMRDGMLREAAPWLMAAMRDLPGARATVCLFLCAPGRVRDMDRLARRRGWSDHA